MNSKQGRQFLEQLQQSRQQPNFLQKKQQFEQQSFKTKYLEVAKTEMAQLSDREAFLREQLDVRKPVVKHPSLKQFFELFVEEQRQQQELATMYANSFSGCSQQLELLEEVVGNAEQFFSPQRVLSTAEFAAYKKGIERVKRRAVSTQQYILGLQNDLPICNSTFQLFNSFDQQKVEPETLNESFLLQIASLVQNKQQVDMYAAAFKVNRQKLLVYYNAIVDKKRQNKEVRNLLEAVELEILETADALQKEGVKDQELECPGDGVELRQTAFLTTPIQPSSSKSAMSIMRGEATIKSLQSDRNLDDLFAHRAKQQAEAEMRKKLDKMSAANAAADTAANAAYTAKITEYRRLISEREQMIKNKAKKAELERMQRRIEAAERDALTVRPNVQFSEERLHAPTQAMLNRQKDTAQRAVYAGLDGVDVDGQQIGAAQFGADYEDKKPSFVAMNVLAERGLLNTGAAQEALARLRNQEIGNRFGGCLRDDVGKLFM